MQTYLKKYKFQNLLIILELICTNLLLLASTLITMRMARLVMDGDFKGIVICSLLIIVIYLILHFMFWKNDVHTTKVIARMNQDMRRDLNRRILAAGTQELGENDTGEYISWYTNNLKEAENQGFLNFYNAVDAIIKLIIGTVTLAMIQWKLLLCTVLTTGMVYLYTHFFPGDVSEESKKVSDEWESFTQIVKEQLQGVTVLKYFGHQKDFKNRIGQASEQLENQRYRYVKCKGKASLKMKAVNALAGLINNLVLFGMCAFRIIPAEIFFGGGNLTYQVKDAILSLSELKIAFAGAKPYFDKIIYQEKNDKKKEPLPPVKEKIEIKNLGFSYPGHVVFEHLNMDFKIGGKYALVGESGSGKTTLLRLLLGQLQVNKGAVLFDQTDACAYDPKSFSDQMAYIEQNVFLFHTTIRENITLGGDFTEEQIEEALRNSALYKDLRLFENGLDTDVGENGRKLSGGQRQRIAVARALIHNRKILIMDEGTSALDKENAKIIEESLLEEPDITLILVSHHLDKNKKEKYTKVYHLGEKVSA